MSRSGEHYIDEMDRRFDSWSPHTNQNEPCKLCGQPYWMHNGPVCPNDPVPPPCEDLSWMDKRREDQRNE